MTRDEAIAAASGARAAFRVPPAHGLMGAEKRIAEFVVGETSRVVDELPLPGPVYDLLVWIVTFGAEGSSVALSVCDATGRVVRVRRSR